HCTRFRGECRTDYCICAFQPFIKRYPFGGHAVSEHLKALSRVTVDQKPEFSGDGGAGKPNTNHAIMRFQSFEILARYMQTCRVAETFRGAPRTLCPVIIRTYQSTTESLEKIVECRIGQQRLAFD